MTKSRLPVGMAACGLLLAVFLLARPAVQAQSGGPVLTATVLGPNVTFTWTAVPGATSYTLRAGIASGQFPPVSINVGSATTYPGVAPFVGSYFAVVDAVVNGVAVPSNQVNFDITSMVAPPAAPTNFAAYVNGTSALLTWELGIGGRAPTSMLLSAGTAPGLSDAGVFPIQAGTQLVAPGVNPGRYYLRIAAVRQGIVSASSNEVEFDMPVGGGCSAPPARTFTPTVFGRYVQISWVPVPGVSGYRFDFSTSPGGPIVATQNVGPTSTRFSVNNVANGVYYGRMTTAFSCGQQTTGGETPVTVDGAAPPGPRAPNPAPGTLIPFSSIAWGAGVVDQLARERPDLLAQSCREHGGNNRFMFEAVRRLRARDNRFGLNWKRGNVGDLSQDIVNYNPTDQSDEGNRNPYIIDIIGGHCGPSPSAFWQDQTRATRDAGTIGIWTLIPYLDAGYPIVSDSLPPQ